MSVLELRKIHFAYGASAGEAPVLEGASLNLASGQIMSLVGPSGSGKSTLLGIAGLLEAPDSGEVFVTGIDCSQQTERERTELRSRKVGFLFQQPHLISHLTVLENVALPLLARRWRANPQIALGLLESVGLADHARKLPTELSGGQAQRVAFCRAIACRPVLLIADEPTASLDEESADGIRRLMRAAANRGVAVLMATHDPLNAAFSDRVGLVDDGVVVESDLPALASKDGISR